jgi:hypothetical protein
VDNSFFSVTNEDLRRLGPSEAVALISELLWAEATRLGIPIGKIHISANVNTPDDGVDAKVGVRFAELAWANFFCLVRA